MMKNLVVILPVLALVAFPFPAEAHGFGDLFIVGLWLALIVFASFTAAIVLPVKSWGRFVVFFAGLAGGIGMGVLMYNTILPYYSDHRFRDAASPMLGYVVTAACGFSALMASICAARLLNRKKIFSREMAKWFLVWLGLLLLCAIGPMIPVMLAKR